MLINADWFEFIDFCVLFIIFFGTSFLVKKLLLNNSKSEKQSRITGYLIGGVLTGIAMSLMINIPLIYALPLGILTSGGIIFNDWWYDTFNLYIEKVIRLLLRKMN